MQRVWYHGTNESSAHNICEHGIDFTKSKKELDFGRGFYMTDDKNVAKKRAQTQTKKYNRIYRKKDKPAVVVITINIDMVNTFNKDSIIAMKNGCILYWQTDFLMNMYNKIVWRIILIRNMI